MYEEIRSAILRDITAKGFRAVGFTLTCTEETLAQRHKKRGDPNECSFEWLRLPPYPGDYVIHTDGKTPREVAEEMGALLLLEEARLKTEDLLLRPVEEADLLEVAGAWDLERKISLEEARSQIHRMEENHRKNRPGRIYHLCLALAEQAAPEKIVGWCGLDGTSGERLDLFYSILPEFRGRGYATQAAKAVLNYAFRKAGVPVVHGGCYRENLASRRVMEKAGMRRRGAEENGDPLFLAERGASGCG